MTTREFWDNKRVFVTGANGFLGSWVARKLVERGAQVVCLQRDVLPRALFVIEGVAQRVTIAHGMLEDLATVMRIVNEFEVDSIFHLAAQPIVSTALRAPVSTFESNIRGTWNLLEAARLCPLVRRVAVASSDKVYGSAARLPYTEDMPLAGRGPYEVSKVCEDVLAQSYHTTYGTPLTIARCGNFYGPGDWNMSRIVPGTIRALCRDEAPIIRSDGQFVRDYLYIEDAAEAYLRMAELTEVTGICGETFNFGTGAPTTVVHLVEELLRVAGKTQVRPVIRNKAQHEIRAQYLDWSKAKRLLEWEPRMTLSEGLRVTFEWYVEHLKYDSVATA